MAVTNSQPHSIDRPSLVSYSWPVPDAETSPMPSSSTRQFLPTWSHIPAETRTVHITVYKNLSRLSWSGIQRGPVWFGGEALLTARRSPKELGLTITRDSRATQSKNQYYWYIFWILKRTQLKAYCKFERFKLSYLVKISSWQFSYHHSIFITFHYNHQFSL